MKVILISAIPFIKTSLGLFPPVGSMAVASTLLKHGYQTVLIDVSEDTDWQKRLRAELDSDNIIAVGVSAYTSSSIQIALDSIQIVRSVSKDIAVIWGGYHASAVWHEILSEGLADVVIRASGEIAVTEVVTELAAKKKLALCDFSAIDNVAYRSGDNIVSNPVRLKVDDHNIPVLDYSLINRSNYSSMDDGRIFVYSSHGCPSRCTFCSESSHTNGLWAGFSAKRVVDDIVHYMHSYGATRIDYLDANFAADPNRVIEVCRMIIARKIDVHISANMKVRDINTIQKRAGLSLLREAGFDEIFVGGESGSDRILEYLHKGSTRAEILMACKGLYEAEIDAKFSFMHDLPAETMADSRATISLAKEMCQYSNIRQVHHIFFPFPNTVIYDALFPKDKPFSQNEWVEHTVRTTFGGSSLYAGNKDIRRYVKAEIEQLKENYPTIFRDQSVLIV